MARKFVEVQFGFGAKTHLGIEAGSNIILTVCGSRKAGTSKRVLGEANLAEFVEATDSCEKCGQKAEKLAA
jgi:hypothetical protein